jgi:hypothetical protein
LKVKIEFRIWLHGVVLKNNNSISKSFVSRRLVHSEAKARNDMVDLELE